MKKNAVIFFSLDSVVEVQLTKKGAIIMEFNLLREFGFVESLGYYSELGRIGLGEDAETPIVKLKFGRLLSLCDDAFCKMDEIFMGDLKLVVYEYDDEDKN